MVEVGRFETRMDAWFARSLLAQAGIPCVLAPDESVRAFPTDFSGPARLLVAGADAEAAATILERYAQGEEDPR